MSEERKDVGAQRARERLSRLGAYTVPLVATVEATAASEPTEAMGEGDIIDERAAVPAARAPGLATLAVGLATAGALGLRRRRRRRKDSSAQGSATRDRSDSD